MRITPVLSIVLVFALFVGTDIARADDEEELSAAATRIVGADLAALFTDLKAEGWYEDGGSWYFFREHYRPDGTIKGVGGPSSDKDKWNWNGKWAIDEDNPDEVCLRYPATSQYYCREIYLDGGIYKAVTDGEVGAYWEPQS